MLLCRYVCSALSKKHTNFCKIIRHIHPYIDWLVLFGGKNLHFRLGSVYCKDNCLATAHMHCYFGLSCGVLFYFL